MNATMSGAPPLTLGEVWDRSIQLIGDNFTLFATTVAVVAVPETVLALLVYLGGGIGLSSIVAFVGTILISGAMTKLVAARYVGMGGSLSPTEAYSSISPGTYITLLAAFILTAIAVAIGLVLLIVPGLILLVGWAFFQQALVLEGHGPTDCLSRSWDLTRGNRLRLFGIGLTFFIVVVIAEGIVSAILIVPFHGVGQIIASNLISPVLFTPLLYAGLTVVYYDLRKQKEGFQPGSARETDVFQPR